MNKIKPDELYNIPEIIKKDMHSNYKKWRGRMFYKAIEDEKLKCRTLGKYKVFYGKYALEVIAEWDKERKRRERLRCQNPKCKKKLHGRRTVFCSDKCRWKGEWLRRKQLMKKGEALG